MSATPDWAGEPKPCDECGRQIDYDYSRELYVHLDGRPCALNDHEDAGFYVTVYVGGAASREAAEKAVGEMLDAQERTDGLTAAVVPE